MGRHHLLRQFNKLMRSVTPKRENNGMFEVGGGCYKSSANFHLSSLQTRTIFSYNEIYCVFFNTIVRCTENALSTYIFTMNVFTINCICVRSTHITYVPIYRLQTKQICGYILTCYIHTHIHVIDIDLIRGDWGYMSQFSLPDF